MFLRYVAKQGLADHLDFCLHAIRCQAERCPPLVDRTNVAYVRLKAGPKKNKAGHEQKLQMLVLGLLRDEYNRKVHA